MDRHQQILETVGLIYDAAIDPAGWPEVRRKLSGLIDAESALLRVVDFDELRVGFSAVWGFDEDRLRQYRDHYIKLDPFQPILRNLPEGLILPHEAALSERDWKKTVYCNEFALPQKKVHTIGGVVVRQGHRWAMIGVQRGPTALPFDMADAELISELLPHLRRAIHIGSKMAKSEAKSETLQETLNRLPFGVVALDSKGTAVAWNTEADKILAAGMGVRLRQGRLVCTAAQQNQVLQGLVSRALGKAGGATEGGAFSFPAPDSENERLAVMVIPPGSRMLPELLTLDGDDPYVVVIVSRENRALDYGYQSLKQVYGVTRTEVRLANDLVNGLDVDDVAEKYGVSRNTVRTQIKALFQKTRARRQPDLIRKLMLGPLLFDQRR